MFSRREGDTAIFVDHTSQASGQEIAFPAVVSDVQHPLLGTVKVAHFEGRESWLLSGAPNRVLAFDYGEVGVQGAEEAVEKLFARLAEYPQARLRTPSS